MPDEEYAAVFTSPDVHELGLAKRLLDEAGIANAISGGSASAFLGAFLGSGGTGVQSLVVPKSEEERALDVLEAAFGGGEGESTDADGAVV